jgi:hypothetical protein
MNDRFRFDQLSAQGRCEPDASGSTRPRVCENALIA